MPETDLQVQSRQAPQTLASVRSLPIVSREDVFGPAEPPRPKDIGAIGDGRKKTTPEYDNTHIEQLLRTLNLTSPAHFTSKPPLTLDINPTNSDSPDFSPASVSSALLTPTDFSPPKSFDIMPQSPTEFHFLPHSSSLLFDRHSPKHSQEPLTSNPHPSRSLPTNAFPIFEPFSEPPTPAPTITPMLYHKSSHNTLSQLYTSPRRAEPASPASMDWRLTHDIRDYQHQHQQLAAPPALRRVSNPQEYNFSAPSNDEQLRSSFIFQQQSQNQSFHASHEPINFLSLLHPSSSPPYHVFVSRIIKSSDQQASIFLQQKLKVADGEERAKIVDAICARGFEMMAHRFGNWAVQRCLEAASTPDERRKIVSCMRGRIVELATNCYGCHVLQKALDCEEDIRLLIVSELLLGDPAQTLVNKHASHVWSKIMELAWTPPAPPIFAYVNKSLKGKWASLACHETGSLVVQHAFENLEEEAKDGIVEELLGQGSEVFAEVAKSQWGSYCIQHILEHGSEKHRRMTLDHLLDGLLEFATHEQGFKSITKALKEGGKETLDKVVKRMCEPAKGARRAMIVDLALSVTGSQLIASVLPTADKDQRAILYDCIRGHIVTLRGCKTGSKVIWLLSRLLTAHLVSQ
ncbi:armadillo-type protein [Crucibulum laeve]|uniref:Armadillo-type protein n=1 Tax=Crucibulum laeve TaxID=68775 RepID=A0A5C3MED2_9AGAR|nr:armadillo-type protein [Crucibulum laeve]